jgi:microcystin-dependent protein
MADPFFAEIRIFGFNYSPLDWAYCDGTVMNVQQNTPLYSLIGNTYGGTSPSTFALPNLKAQAVMGTSPQYLLNAKGGAPTVALNPSQMPVHDHTANCSLEAGNSTAPLGNFPAAFSGATNPMPYINYVKASPKPTMVTLSPSAMAMAGQTTPQGHENRQPYLTMNFCICTNGVYPIFP